MANFVRFIVYANGNIVDGSNGPQYDRPPIGKVKVRMNANYEEFIEVLCQKIGVDRNEVEVEVIHRHAHYLSHGALYMLMPITDDGSYEDLIALASELGARLIQEIFVNTNAKSGTTELLNVAGHHNLNIIHGGADDDYPNNESDIREEQNCPTSPMVYEEYDTVGVNESMVDFESRVEEEVAPVLNSEVQDDQFNSYYCVDENGDIVEQEEGEEVGEELIEEEGGCNIPSTGPQSSMSPEPSRNAIVRDAIPYFNVGAGGDGYVTFEDDVNAMSSNICDGENLTKGMMFNTKEDLIHYVKGFHIRTHCNF